MAERSTAAVGVAKESGGAPLTDRKAGTTTDGTTDLPDAQEIEQSETESPELHSGHKLARRYRLEDCLARLDSFSSWKAVDEKLRRAVGIHVLPADHERARNVLAAARSAALLGDPRFVQVLDAVEENNLVYVIHEWLPGATDLATILADHPLEPHDAYQMVSQVSQAMAAAHREGLSHLRLSPDSVLRTDTGQYRIRGLAVAAALHGTKSDRPQREDTEAIGALLYASLTQRWPYPADAYGLTGLPKAVGLIAPDQVRAGVHRGLSELAMRALVNDGATASRQEQPCATPEELAAAVAKIPKIQPPEPELPTFQRTTYQSTTYQQDYHRPAVTDRTAPAPAPLPPTLPGRTGKVLKWAVSALLIAALGLGSWQLADTLLGSEKVSEPKSTSQNEGASAPPKAPAPLEIKGATEYYPDGKQQPGEDVGVTYDGDPASYWRTYSYQDGPELAPYKQGVGIVYDLGSPQKISEVSIGFQYGGDHTSATLYATDSLSSSAPLSGMTEIGKGSTKNTTLKMPVGEKAEETRYVLVWVTAFPRSVGDQYSPGLKYRQGIADVTITG